MCLCIWTGRVVKCLSQVLLHDAVALLQLESCLAAPFYAWMAMRTKKKCICRKHLVLQHGRGQLAVSMLLQVGPSSHPAPYTGNEEKGLQHSILGWPRCLSSVCCLYIA